MRGSKVETAEGSGVWRLRVYAGLDPLTRRKRVRERRFHGTSRQAENELAAMVASATRGQGGGSQTTLTSCIEQWLDLIRADRSPSTIIGYEVILAVHIAPALGHKRLFELGAADLDRFYRALRAKPLSAGRVMRIHSVIRAALNQAVKWEWIERNVAMRATVPGGPKFTPMQLTVPEVRAALEQQLSIDPDLAVLFVTAAATGKRRGELCGLQWRDLDLDRGEVTIRQAVIRVKGPDRERGVNILKDTKSHAERTIAIDSATVAILAEYRRACLERARVCEMRLAPSAFVWSRDPAGRVPLNPDVVSGAWRRLMRRQGLEGRRFHDVRHFHASVLIDKGAPIAMVSERLGHRNLTTTMDIYTHAGAARDREAATMIGELLSGGG
jgi:integrase